LTGRAAVAKGHPFVFKTRTRPRLKTKEETMTNAAAHTPGPWRVLDVFTNLEIVTDRPTANETESIVQFKGQRNAKANARLMVAAPELLQALNALHQLVTLESDLAFHLANVHARGVIDKATGA
jgi:hypothetical protein